MGLSTDGEDNVDEQLIHDLLELMAAAGADYTLFFRNVFTQFVAHASDEAAAEVDEKLFLPYSKAVSTSSDPKPGSSDPVPVAPTLTNWKAWAKRYR